MCGAVPTADCKAFSIVPLCKELYVSWMNLKRKMEALAHDARLAIHGVRTKAARSQRSLKPDTMSPADVPLDQGQSTCQPPRNRRAERTRSWRRRALSRKGA